VRRRLDAELVRRGLVPSRARATDAISAGRVLVAGSLATTPARQVATDESISLTAPPRQFVSRGGHKLDAALGAFPVHVAGRRALDAGASTGGFTDCLLRRDAARVYAVDVGRGQLDWALRSDVRVTVLDRTNVKQLSADRLEGAVPLVVADLSFISLVRVAPALVACATDDADFVLLVKPQFEAGREGVGKRGIVRDPEVHAAVLTEVADGLAAAGLVVLDAIESPLRGADGNREFLVHARRTGIPIEPTRLVALGYGDPS
jgi:23S rRNA (cytidine1920-2'-O)/16S rRNA (cytidine1409-2'-O)-methyltransferase